MLPRSMCVVWASFVACQSRSAGSAADDVRLLLVGCRELGCVQGPRSGDGSHQRPTPQHFATDQSRCEFGDKGVLGRVHEERGSTSRGTITRITCLHYTTEMQSPVGMPLSRTTWAEQLSYLWEVPTLEPGRCLRVLALLSPVDHLSSVFLGRGNSTPKHVFDRFRPCSEGPMFYGSGTCTLGRV